MLHRLGSGEHNKNKVNEKYDSWTEKCCVVLFVITFLMLYIVL